MRQTTATMHAILTALILSLLPPPPAWAQALTPAEMNRMGVMYHHGQGVRQSYSSAVRWFRDAAEAGHAEGMFNLGVMYERGRGVAQSDSEAARWYRAAAEAGHGSAMLNLGVMYQRGLGVGQSSSEALRWYRAAADAGNAQGMHNLGWMYFNGRGVAQNNAEAARWWRAAHDAGLHAQEGFSGAAWTRLGEFHHYGRGVAQNDAEAALWFGRAADRGHSEGKWWLAWAHAHGRGVPQDPARAADLLLRSERAGLRWFRNAPQNIPAATLRAVQQRLREAGHFTVPPTGHFGQRTLAALRAYVGE